MSGTAYSQVPSWEREALIAIYNATDGENWVYGWGGEQYVETLCSFNYLGIRR